jgi:DNA processing protein
VITLTACDECLRRAWLVAALAPLIECSASDAPGSRTRELLALPDAELARAVGRGASGALSENRALAPGGCRRELEAAGLWAVCRHDAGYPEALRQPADAPALLTGCGDAALLADLELHLTVTVVGARRASAYGRAVARDLGAGLATAGMTVVSGMAYGIDGAAHRGALDGGGRTVAVLGAGPERASPRGQERLYREIRERGVIVAEFPPGVRPYRWSFPARNRIMAALGGMTVVVEAAEYSGSLITATMADDLGRDLGAVPGPVTAALSAGTNGLLAEGAAVIRDAQDVLDALLGPGQRALPRLGPGIGEELGRLLDSVERGCATADAVASASSIPPARVAAGLVELELFGYLVREPAGRYTRTGLEPPGGEPDPPIS